MKEILLSFEEFLNRLPYGVRVHSSSRREESQVAISWTFRLSFPESSNHIVVFEKNASFLIFEDDKFRAFGEECRALAERVSATPGYYEDEVIV